MLQKTHHDRCQEFFSEVRHGHEVWVHFDEINEDDEENTYLSFSVFTNSMLYYDAEASYYQDYRPYFCSFIARKNEQSLRFIREHGELLNTDDEDNGDRWFRAIISRESRVDAQRVLFDLDGQVEFSASPVEYEDNHLKIVDGRMPKHLLDQINATYTVAVKTDAEINRCFDSLVVNPVLIFAQIYKVGHGNLINVHGVDLANGENRNFLYDVGFHRGSHAGSSHTPYVCAKRAIAAMKPDFVILSHWDADHIMGVVEAPNAIFDVPWIAPDVKGCSLNARRLACYLDKKKSMFLVEKRDRSRCVTRQGRFKLFIGKNKSVDGVSKANCAGLVIMQHTYIMNSILCGDVPYNALSPSVWAAEYENLVIPHHARKMSTTSVKTLTCRRQGDAVYCHNGFGDSDHIKELQSKHYRVYRTEDARTWGYLMTLL